MFTTKVVGYKKPLFKVIAHKDFLFKTSFKQMVLKYGVCSTRLPSFRLWRKHNQAVGTQKSLYTLNQRMRYFNLCKRLIMHKMNL